VEALQDLLAGLLRDREQLRGAGADAALEENRREIVRVQQLLSQALIALYGAR